MCPLCATHFPLTGEASRARILPMAAPGGNVVPLARRRARQDGYRLYTLEDLIALEDDPLRWIIPNMLPKDKGKVVVYGFGGDYKSTLMFDIAVAVASGGLALHQFPVYRQGRVVAICTEGNKYTNGARLAAMLRARNLHPGKVDLLFGDRPLKLHDARGRQVLADIVTKLRPLLLLLDPYRAFFAGDENSTKETNQFTDAVDEIQDICGTTVIIVHHARKDGQLRGNLGLYNWADMVLHFQVARKQKLAGVPEPKDIVKVTAEKARDGEEGDLFCAIPFFDKALGITTFAWYDGSPRDAARVHLMLAIYRLLVEANVPLTTFDIQQVLRTGAERCNEALAALAAGGFVAQDVVVHRATSATGTRRRNVPAWRALVRTSLVDTTAAILRAIRKELEDAPEFPGPP